MTLGLVSRASAAPLWGLAMTERDLGATPTGGAGRRARWRGGVAGERLVGWTGLVLAVVLGSIAVVSSPVAGDDSDGAGQSVEVRIVARKLSTGKIEFGVQPVLADGSRGERLLPSRRLFPADAAVGRWLVSSPQPLAVGASTEAVRITARQHADGRVEFGLQQQVDDSWSQRLLPQQRFFPATASVGRWLQSSPLTITAASQVGGSEPACVDNPTDPSQIPCDVEAAPTVDRVLIVRPHDEANRFEGFEHYCREPNRLPDNTCAEYTIRTVALPVVPGYRYAVEQFDEYGDLAFRNDYEVLHISPETIVFAANNIHHGEEVYAVTVRYQRTFYGFDNGCVVVRLSAWRAADGVAWHLAGSSDLPPVPQDACA